ncbi:hypothetical protein PV325_008874 [Microctonus aethiopoides]|nr:hypothetical protein PV325_008874 [Microctonus aethiopoides]
MCQRRRTPTNMRKITKYISHLPFRHPYRMLRRITAAKSNTDYILEQVWTILKGYIKVYLLNIRKELRKKNLIEEFVDNFFNITEQQEIKRFHRIIVWIIRIYGYKIN